MSTNEIMELIPKRIQNIQKQICKTMDEMALEIKLKAKDLSYDQFGEVHDKVESWMTKANIPYVL